MMKTNWHHDAAQKQGESIPSFHRTLRMKPRKAGEFRR
jgi:hypothetical protein